MKLLEATLLATALFAATTLHAQGAMPIIDPLDLYGSTNTITLFASYANDSSHIIIGQEQNRKLAELGIGYSRRIHRAKHFDFSWEPELRPFAYIRDPFVDGDSTIVVHGTPTIIIGLPFSGHFNGPTTANCASGTTVYNGVTQNGVSYTQTIAQQCSSRWTYAAGVSPLGLRFTFARQHRLEPFLVANGGMMISTVDVPVNNSSRANFTFEGGAGFEWFRDPHHAIALDYRLHHLSNGYRGFYNPGIDSQVLRLSYRFGH